MMFGPGAFRLFLALCVCVGHLSRINIGETAVCVFFLLSGYWVVRMYREKYVHLPHPNASFWIARFLRIWVVYAVCLIAAMLVYMAVLDRYDPARWYGLFLFGTATHGNDILGVSWSLDIEVQFYLLVPIIAAALLLARRPAGLALALAAGAALSVFGLYLEARFEIQVVLAYLILFLAGALIYELRFRPRGAVILVSCLLFLAVAAGVLAHPDLKALLDKRLDNPFDDRWFAIVWALLLIPLVAWNVRQDSSRFDRHLGNLSYCVYLVHVPFYNAAGILLDGATAFEKLGLLALTVPLALVPYLLVDRPVERHRERLSLILAAWLNGDRGALTTAPAQARDGKPGRPTPRGSGMR